MRIIEKLSCINNIKYTCNFNCGFADNDIKNIINHYNSGELNCNKKIIQCKTELCPFIGINGKQIIEHTKNCPFMILCPLCYNFKAKSKEEFCTHISNYHKIGLELVP